MNRDQPPQEPQRPQPPQTHQPQTHPSPQTSHHAQHGGAHGAHGGTHGTHATHAAPHNGGHNGGHNGHSNGKSSARRVILIASVVSALVAGVAGGVAGFTAANISAKSGNARQLELDGDNGSSIRQGGLVGREDSPANEAKRMIIDEESAVIDVVRTVSPAVVSIIVTRELRNFDPYSGFFGGELGDQGTIRREIGGGTGFIVSKDGMILTNKHVVADTEAEYSVLTNDGKTHKAVVLARDPTNDLAIIQIEGANLPTVKIGDSAGVQIGQKVIAIGNALGEYRNTVSTGVISGMARKITASDGNGQSPSELRDVLQTDAAINPGNSGGPLLDIEGKVIGINTAVAEGAQNIGFALPIDEAKADLESVKRTGKIVRPILGVRYIPVNPIIQQQGSLSVDYGAYIPLNDVDGAPSIEPDGPADKAGLKPGDIILEISGQKLDDEHPLPLALARRQVGDKVSLKVRRGTEDLTLEATLGSASF